MKINELCKLAHDNAVEKGFYDNGDKNIGELLMLVVSELGEALESHRRDFFTDWNHFNILTERGVDFKTCFGAIKDTFEDELADAVIRIADMCSYLNIDLEKHIDLKMRYNATREYKHGKRY